MEVVYNSIADDIVDIETRASLAERTIKYIKLTQWEYKQLKKDLAPMEFPEYMSRETMGKVSNLLIVGIDYEESI